MDEALDPFRITDKLEDPLLEVMVSRLEGEESTGSSRRCCATTWMRWISTPPKLYLIWDAEQGWRHARSLVERIFRAGLQG